jgi:hypothetical protein
MTSETTDTNARLHKANTGGKKSYQCNIESQHKNQEMIWVQSENISFTEVP